MTFLEFCLDLIPDVNTSELPYHINFPVPGQLVAVAWDLADLSDPLAPNA